MKKRFALALAAVAIFCGTRCSTVSDSVTVYPVLLRFTDDNRRLTSVSQLVENLEYGRAIGISWTIDERKNPSVRDLATLGQAEVAGGRFEDARRHLEMALTLSPPRQTLAEVYWDLSQADYLQNRFPEAFENAQNAARNGLKIRPWALDLLEVLASQKESLIRVEAVASGNLPMAFGNPAIPRVQTVLNESTQIEGVIDTGAVFTIVSHSVAERAGIRRLGVTGTLIGLLGEPIRVEYGILDHLQIGGVRVTKLPVAIMPNDQLRFFVAGRERFEISLLLGSNLLKEFRLELDYGRKSIRLTPLQLTRADPESEPNMFYVDYRPMIHVAIDRHGWFLFLLDTGSEITFLNHTMLKESRLGHWSRAHSSTLQGLGGSTKRGSSLQDVELTVSGWAGAFSTIPLYASEPPAFGIVGENFLRHFNVVIDFGKMRIDLIEGQ